MNTMRIGPLYEDPARCGDKGAAEKYLRELAARILSDDHDTEDCTRVAAILERLAAGGPKAWAAAGFAPAHRHGESDRDLLIWERVNDLIDRGVGVETARRRVAKSVELSHSQVKKIHLRYERARELTWTEGDRLAAETD